MQGLFISYSAPVMSYIEKINRTRFFDLLIFRAVTSISFFFYFLFVLIPCDCFQSRGYVFIGVFVTKSSERRQRFHEKNNFYDNYYVNVTINASNF